MAKHNILGKTGEQIAAEYLIEHGYDIRETNWRSGRFEIDIIATRETTLVIVEVKTRQTDVFGMPEDAVDNRKIRHLINAADAYIRMTGLPFEIRFDIISVICNNDGCQIEHIENAFYPPIQNSRYGY
ncbi:MAG: YraN family protein [Coprobacter sp.]|nr:YraN family protein [Coprobacter sp.]